MRFPSRAIVESIRSQFPVGARVALDYMSDPYYDMTPGMEGTVKSVDDTGTIHVRWDEGMSLGVVFGVDSCHVIGGANG